ncbi:uncharacterized protein PRCAT00005735001 [Priceomyces carsonii]|uniref:uncharacterized protein n=1 Tax=Priceomyces carsonii TaxID=28549 RepID=UPI002EDACDAC|nr:unnamed protein product [Priceomyces carsonii]
MNAIFESISQQSAKEQYDDITFAELPFFPLTSDPILDITIDDLLANGHTNATYPSDGFLSFHSLKICSSNAKQMSKNLQLTMGFEEIAYRGLETDSRFIASHVLKNGDIILELVNTLETVEEDNALKVPYYQKDISNFKHFGKQDLSTKIANKIANEFVTDRVSVLSTSNESQNLGRKIYNKILNSKTYKSSLRDYEKVIKKSMTNSENIYEDMVECALIQKFLKSHAEGVMDIAFQVTDVDASFAKAINAGAGIIKVPRVLSDEYGSVKLATIAIPDTDLQHTLVQIIDYCGPYLPNYFLPLQAKSNNLPKLSLSSVNFQSIDHCVENYSWNQMMTQAKFYANIFGFHKFWSIDEQDVSTGETALRSIVMASGNGKIKMPINEPAKARKRGQIEEFNDYNGGPGVQHIAFRTNDIIFTVESLVSRGVEFNTVSEHYYSCLERRLRKDDVILRESFEKLKQLNILVDYDATTRNKSSKRCNYILQIFTKPFHDRPTLFFEIIQRYHHNGFGKGTFKGLFETIEHQQRLRGTLVINEEYADEGF